MSDPSAFRKIGTLKTVDAFREYLAQLSLNLPCDDTVLSESNGSPLGKPLQIGSFVAGNRWAVQPMEGWDGTDDGRPTEHTLRRWQHFGESGAKIIWGGEAFAVQRDGRANPNQLYLQEHSPEDLAALRSRLIDGHERAMGHGSTGDLMVGLQLTHSGRFSRPNRKDLLEPRIAYHHPLLDEKFDIDPADDSVVWTDAEIDGLVQQFVKAAKVAAEAGFDFVDVKHCHGYLGHEFLSAYHRQGAYGGDLHGRTNFLRRIVQGIANECPSLMIGVRLSLFDMPSFHPDPEKTGGGKFGPGIPDAFEGELFPAFGCDRTNPTTLDLSEPIALVKMMRDELGIAALNLSAGSPYYNAHIQRPAFFPPSDGYLPPEDPLVGCFRQMQAVREVREAVSGLPMIGTAYSYLQEYLPHVAQALVRDGWVDAVGLGRMMLSYWQLPVDTLSGLPMRKKQICRTFSDCTTAPRNGILSGCFPLDPFYKKSGEAEQLKAAKAALRKRLTVLNNVETG